MVRVRVRIGCHLKWLPCCFVKQSNVLDSITSLQITVIMLSPMLVITETRNTYCGTWYLPHSQSTMNEVFQLLYPDALFLYPDSLKTRKFRRLSHIRVILQFSDVTILVFSSRFDFDSIFCKDFDVNSISIFSSGNSTWVSAECQWVNTFRTNCDSNATDER